MPSASQSTRRATPTSRGRRRLTTSPRPQALFRGPRAAVTMRSSPSSTPRARRWCTRHTWAGSTTSSARIRLDAQNNAYVMGSTRSADFPTTAGAFDTTHNGAFDVFVTKLNSTGSGLIYSTFIGGSNFDSGQGLATDAAGTAYVTGGTLSLNFPTTPGAFSATPTGNDIFVTKLNATGSALVYSTFLGSAGGGAAVAVDAAGNTYVTGGTRSVVFPTTPDGFQPRFNGGPS